MFIRNTWYVVAWSHEIDGAAFLARTIIDEPLLIYRTEAGGVVAIQDRCCHRQAPLSAGRREGDCIRCGYHGLLFDASGKCIEAPGQDMLPPHARVRCFPAVEHNSWIWVWMGNPALADASELPDTQSLDSSDWFYVPGYLHWNIDQQLSADNVLDFSHLGYVHEKSLGGSPKIAEARPTVQRTKNGVRIEWLLFDIEPAPFLLSIHPFKGNIDRWFHYEFQIPGILTMRSGAQETGTGAREGRRENVVELRSCQAIMPETARSTHYFFGSPHNRAENAQALSETIITGVRAAFEEDHRILEMQQARWTDRQERLVVLSSDVALNHMRRLVKQRLGEEDAAANPGSAGRKAI